MSLLTAYEQLRLCFDQVELVCIYNVMCYKVPIFKGASTLSIFALYLAASSQ